MKMKRYIYIHVACINHWSTVFSELFQRIKQAGLYDTVDEIRLGILGDVNCVVSDSKLKIRGVSKNLSEYETFTLNLLHEDSLQEDFEVLYLHTKGVSKPWNSINIGSWTNYLSHFNIDRWSESCSLLQKYDCVGVNLLPQPKPHYSGNFWWSRASYIRTLKPCVQDTYYAPEFWIGGGEGSKVALWNSNCQHYLVPYPQTEYKDKPAEIYSL
jgi:hypothetical protein